MVTSGLKKLNRPGRCRSHYNPANEISRTDLSPVAIRERILDAAEACLVESGYGTRLHAVISERAGLSRPTVYKYVGDQAEIFEAAVPAGDHPVLHAVDAVLRDSERLDTGLTDCVVFAVGYARRHMLLQKGLRDDPEVVLPVVHGAGPAFVERGTDYLAPLFRTTDDAEQLATIDSRAVCEWAFRW